MGPFAPVTKGGYKYVSTITAKYTKWTAVYFLTSKNQALQLLQLLVGSMVILVGGHIVRWRADKGGEYTGWKFRQYCLETGIIKVFAANNTPQQIGVSERVGRTLCTHGLVHARRQLLSIVYVRVAVHGAAYLNNRSPHNKTLKMETSFKMFHGEEVDLSYLRVNGARSFVHVKNFRKLDAAA